MSHGGTIRCDALDTVCERRKHPEITEEPCVSVCGQAGGRRAAAEAAPVSVFVPKAFHIPSDGGRPAQGWIRRVCSGAHWRQVFKAD